MGQGEKELIKPKDTDKDPFEGIIPPIDLFLYSVEVEATDTILATSKEEAREKYTDWANKYLVSYKIKSIKLKETVE